MGSGPKGGGGSSSGRLDGRIVLLEVGVAFLHLRRIEVIEGQRLLERKDVLGAVVAAQRLGNLGLTALAAPVAQARQDLRVALAGRQSRG